MTAKKKTEALVQAPQFRVPAAFLDRVDKMALRMSRPGLHVTRTEVLRMAVFMGLDQLESESPKPARRA